MMYHPDGKGPFRHSILCHSRREQSTATAPRPSRLRALLARIFYRSARIQPPPSTRPPSRA